MQTAVDGAQVSRPHVLAGVHPEASHAHVDQLVHEASHLPTNVVPLQSQIQEANQTTVSHLHTNSSNTCITLGWRTDMDMED